MLRGHLGSVELLRGLFNPFMKRNFIAGSVRYADEEDKKKSDGMFSWIKDMFHPDTKLGAVQNANDCEATIRDFARAKQATLAHLAKLGDASDTMKENMAVGKSFKGPETHQISRMILEENQKYFSGKFSTFDPKVYNSELSRNKNHYSPSLMKDSFVANVNAKRSYQPPFLHHQLLTLNSPLRTIMGCTPRNTKPPIREPNMPERQEKKDEKKEKKKKKPVIRMDSGMEDNYKQQNETSAAAMEAENRLHDNMEVDFQYQWGIRLPEEVGKNRQKSKSRENWNAKVSPIEGTSSYVGDSDYCQVSPTYDANARHAMRNLQIKMSATEDSEKKVETATKAKESISEEAVKSAEAVVLGAPKEAKETERVESLKKILKTSPSVMKETSVVDEDYNVPSNATFDAEISAWKDLVEKSKVPMNAPKEEFLDPENTRRAEMLSIRPEPPKPKLDVQAIPTVTDEMMDEEEEVDSSRDFKGTLKTVEVKKTASPTEIQKTDNKKLHTSAFCIFKRNGDSGNDLKRRLKFHQLPWTVGLLDDAGLVAAGFSTSAESGWGNFEQDVGKRTAEAAREDQLQAESRQDDPVKEQRIDIGVPSIRNLSSNDTFLSRDQQQQSVSYQQQQVTRFEQQEQMDTDEDVADNLNSIAERGIEISMSRTSGENQETRENSMSAHTDSAQRFVPKFESEDHLREKSSNLQGNFEYANSPYEDDFYPGYESMSLEPIVERPAGEKNQHPESPAIIREEQPFEDKENIAEQAQGVKSAANCIVDGNYVRIAGDPYPYSREYFNKWRLHNDHIRIGSSLLPDDPLITDPGSSRQMDLQQPVRKMSYDSRARGKVVHH